MQINYFKTMQDFFDSVNLENNLWLLFVAEETVFNHDSIKNSKLQCYGGIFPEIIFEKQHYKEGLIALSLSLEPILLENIQEPIKNTKNLESIESMLVFVDGLSAFIDPFLVSLFEVSHEECVIFGGGAGKLTFEQESVIFSPDKITQDCALIIPLKEKVGLGVNHGWEYLEGPFVATSSQNNILEQLNYQNAFDVYKNIVQKDSGKVLTDENFFDVAKSYPLGIVSYRGEVIVRDPIAKEESSLILVGSMPQNSIIDILKGDKKKLILAAKKASKEAFERTKNPSLGIMIDCISRVLFLEDSFMDEIDSVTQVLGDTPLIGVLTLGEIANNSDSYIDFYNKTCVIGTLGD